MLLQTWASGGTGIRVRLRTVFRKDWGFESPLAHQINAIENKKTTKCGFLS